jgi:histidine triad (HIT) family protein
MTIFSKIISGEVPSFQIFENDHVFAFLDINPVRPGHTLVVPKIEIDYFADVPEPYYGSVFQAAKTLSNPLLQATGAKRIALQVQGLDVPHFHLHLIPISQPGDLYHQPAPANPEDLQKIQTEILKYITTIPTNEL